MRDLELSGFGMFWRCHTGWSCNFHPFSRPSKSQSIKSIKGWQNVALAVWPIISSRHVAEDVECQKNDVTLW